MEIRARPLLECVTVFALVMLHIWFIARHLRWFWIVPLGLVFWLQWRRRESPYQLGFRLDNLAACITQIAPGVVALALVLIGIAFAERSIRTVSWTWAASGLLAYWAWGLFQQYILQAFFTHRFERFFGPRRPASAALASACLFGAAHLPNAFLMAVTFAAGFASARYYLYRRNLFILGWAHGFLGTLLYLLTPDSLSHHLWIGPGYFRH